MRNWLTFLSNTNPPTLVHKLYILTFTMLLLLISRFLLFVYYILNLSKIKPQIASKQYNEKQREGSLIAQNLASPVRVPKKLSLPSIFIMPFFKRIFHLPSRLVIFSYWHTIILSVSNCSSSSVISSLEFNGSSLESNGSSSV